MKFIKVILALVLCASLMCLCASCGDVSSSSTSSKPSSPSSTSSKKPSSVADPSSDVVSETTSKTDVSKPVVKIMPIGDSLTQGGQHKTSAYRGFLSEMLTEGGYSTKFVGCHNWSSDFITDGNVMHSGFGGAKTYTLAKELPSMAECDPDIILLMIGRNDITEGTNPTNLVDYINKHLVQELYKMFPDVHIFVASVPVIRNMSAEELKLDSDTKYAPKIKEYVEGQKAAGKKMDFVDMSVAYTNLTWEDFTAEDFVHPQPEGYKKIAKRWYDCITDKITEIADSKAAA